MRLPRIVIACLLVAGMSTPALAGDLQTSMNRAAETQPQPQSEQRPIPKGYLWAGSAMFVGGMTVGIFGFLRNRNGSFPTFDEANATNKHLGAAGLITAFAGGTVLAIGAYRARHAPMVTIGAGRVTVTKQLSW